MTMNACLLSGNRAIKNLFILVASLLVFFALDAAAGTLFVAPGSLSAQVPQGGTTNAELKLSSDGAWIEVRGSSFTPWLNVAEAVVHAGSGLQGTGTLSVAFNAGSLASGTYTGSVMLTATGAVNSPVVAPCIMTVLSSPYVPQVYPPSLSVSHSAGTAYPQPSLLTVGNRGTADMEFNVSSDVPWMIPSLASGVVTGPSVQVLLSYTNLPLGIYTGRVTVTAVEQVNSPRVIPVVMRSSWPVPSIHLSTNRVSVQASQEGDAVNALFDVINDQPAHGAVPYTVTTLSDWLTAVPTNGACETADEIFLTMNPAGLAHGFHRGTLLVRKEGADENLVVSVELTIAPANRVIASDGPWDATVLVGSVVTQQFRIWNAGTGVLSYSIASVPAWLSVQPTSGQSTNGGEVVHQAVFRATNLAEGAHAGTLRLSSYSGVVNSPLDVPVSLDVAAHFEAEHPRYELNVQLTGGLQTWPLSLHNAGSTNPAPFQLVRFGQAFTLSSTSGISSGTAVDINIQVTPAGLNAGVHRGWVDLLGEGGFSHRLPVDVFVHPTNQLYEESLVFSRLENGDRDIWTVRPDGTGLRPLVVRAGDQTSPQLSPDGNQLLFREQAPGEPRRLVALDLRDGITTYLTDMETPRWMADSSAIAGVVDDPVTKGGWGGRVRVQSLEGVPVRTLWQSQSPVRLLGVDPLERVVAIEQMAASSVTRMIRQSPGMREPQVLRAGAGLSDRNGSISFDGEQAVFEAAGGGDAVVLSMAVRTGETAQPVPSEEAAPQSWPALSPAGDRLAIIVPATQGQAVATFQTNGLDRLELFSVESPVEVAELSWGFMAYSLNTITVSTQALFSTATTRSTNTVSVSFGVRGSTNMTLNYGVSGGGESFWHDKPEGGISTGQMDVVTLTAAPMNLAPGTHVRRFLVAGHAANAPVEVVWTLEVLPLPSRLFAVAVSEAIGFQGITGLVDRTLALVREGDADAAWSLSANQPWISFDVSSGISTGEETEVQLRFDPAGLASGIYTAEITMVQGQGAGSYTQVFVSTFQVTEDYNIGPPALSVSTNLFRVSTPRYQNPTSLYLQVWNRGGNGIGGTNPLKYVVHKVNPSQSGWLKIAPGLGTYTNRGERDVFRMDLDVDEFVSSSVSAQLWIYPEGLAAEHETVDVQVSFTAPMRHTLDAQDSSFITLHCDPPPDGDGKYAYNTDVRVRAEPDYGYAVREWAGNAQGSATQVTVRIQGDSWVFAYARKQTLLAGFITNSLTGEPVTGATVRLEVNGIVRTTQTTSSGMSPGSYAMEPLSPTVVMSVEAPGYLSRPSLRPVIVTNNWNVFNVALTPVIFKHVDFFDWDPRTMIVRYTLSGSSQTTYPVDMDVSLDGKTWQAPNQYPAHVDGDVATNVQVGASGQKFFWWHLADNYPYVNMSNVRVRVRSGGQSITSSVFAIKTGTAHNPTIYAYNDMTYGRGESNFRGAEVYIGGRTTNHLRGLTDINGLFTWQGGSLYVGDTIFVRRKYNTKPAVRNSHGQVDDVMYTLWLDSDVGNSDDNDYNSWDGKWRSFTVTQNHIDAVLDGDPIRVPLNHPVFEWNLTMEARPGDFSDGVSWVNLQKALAGASRYLYMITDGQMKFGKLYIAESDISEEDVLLNKGSDTANANVDGIESSPCCWTPRINMYLGNLKTNTFNSWARTLVHEFGHYAFGFYDEYEVDWYSSGTERLDLLKASAPQFYPGNYGFMDGQQNITSMSSVNDYLANYDDYITLDSIFASLEDYVTEHLYENEEPCWTFFEKRFENRIFHGNVAPYDMIRTINLLAQKSGRFENGQPTFPDRLSTDYIPEPYFLCMLKREGGSWFEIRHNHAYTNLLSGVFTGASVQARSSAPGGVVEVLALQDGRPFPGAQVVFQAGATGRQAIMGHTDRGGRCQVASVCPGDTILLNTRGTRLSKTITEAGLNGELVFHLPPKASDRGLQARKDSDPLAMLISGTFDASDYVVSFTPSQPLAALPVISATFNETRTSNLVVVALGETPERYEARVSGYGYTPFSLDIQATSAVCGVFASVDKVIPIPLYSDVEMDTAIIIPSDVLRQRETLGMVYCAYGPAIPPEAPVNLQVPPAIHFALADGSSLSTQAVAGLRLEYGDSLTPGLDEAGLVLMRRGIAATNWLPTSHAVNPAAQTCSAPMTEDGIYALFAPASTDAVPPSAIADLHAECDTNYPLRVLLTWTAPGGDGTNGAATAYELYLSEQPLSGASNNLPEPMALRLTPAPSGSPEQYAFEPEPEKLWYIALIARDEAGNYSPLSNITAVRPSRPLAAGGGFPEQYRSTMALRGYPAFDPDGDEDGDGVSNWEEFLLNTDPLNSDTDGDGMPDGYEVRYGLNPGDPSDAGADLDGDGFPNIEELRVGSDPSRYSSTGDGISDSWKHRYGLPLLRGLDPEEDADEDGFSTHQEYVADTNPGDSTSFLFLGHLTLLNGQWQLNLNASTARCFVVEGLADLGSGEARTLSGPLQGQGAGSLMSGLSTNAVEVFRIRALDPAENLR